MLERLTAAEINTLRNWKQVEPFGPDFSKPFPLAMLVPGAIIRAKTESGNVYLFEMTKPKEALAHVVRCDPRPAATQTGYRGERRLTSTVQLPNGEHTVDCVIRVGEVIMHDGSVTSRVTTLDLIDPSILPMA